MFMKSKDEKQCALYCSCGCENGITFKVEEDKQFGICISLVSDVWYVYGLTKWTRFKSKCKRIWRILCNKEYTYFGMYVDNEDIQEFKDFVAKM